MHITRLPARPASRSVPMSAPASWLDPLRDVDGERAVLLGPDLGAMCALIRRGCAEVTELRREERPEPRMADLVVVPELAAGDAAACMLARARRALSPGGRVLVRTGADPDRRLERQAARTLALHGFSVVSSGRDGERTVIAAELPLFGGVAAQGAA